VVVAKAAEPRKGRLAPGCASVSSSPRRGGSVLALSARLRLNLFLYMGVIALLVVAGLWGAANSWGRRLGSAHVLSLLTVVWGLALLAAEVLPRIGYAAHHAQWMCP
jgi:hypothetical protein